MKGKDCATGRQLKEWPFPEDQGRTSKEERPALTRREKVEAKREREGWYFQVREKIGK